nr:PREDICTED: circadian clock-controlled protein-like [Bemisia tabaci]
MGLTLKYSFALLSLCSCALAAAPQVSNGYYTWYKKPCKQNDAKFTDCLLKTARVGVVELKNGDSKRHLPSINPFFLPKMEITTGSDQVGLKFKMQDVNIHGLPDIQFLNIKGDEKIHKYEWVIQTKTINLDGNYIAGGKILILPVVGNGKFQFSLKDMKCRLKIKHELEKKADGKEYIKFTQVQFIIDDVKHVRYTLHNLFNGDKLLGGQILTFINQAWREVFEEVKPGIEQTMSEVIKYLITPLTRVPYDYIFPPS